MYSCWGVPLSWCFLWLQWVVSSVWTRRTWIRMSGTKIEWATAARTLATGFGFKRKAGAFDTLSILPFPMNWKHSHAHHSTVEFSTPLICRKTYIKLILTPQITNPIMRKLWVITLKKCYVLYYTVEFPGTEKRRKLFWKLGYSTLGNAGGV